ncbi:HAMP domain-containing sensor histidine kinase [uncultured Clostridium sp.]|uniref:sensor histidine kinase n=1 Tax=uncultured Clostridium sp. TaxID=59620 RepID=UPI00260424E5|nr:HAMP domain-containing sensor histidine kinase [uncultured Clostridium sp.]
MKLKNLKKLKMKSNFAEKFIMKNSISKKLILIIFTLIASLVIGFMIFQSFFFQMYYTDKKSEDLQNSLLKFRTMYQYKAATNPSELNSAMALFDVENTAKIAIYSTDGKLRYIVGEKSNPSLEGTLNSIFNKLYYDKRYTNQLLESNKIITTLVSGDSSDKHIVSMAPFSLYHQNDSVLIAISPLRPIQEASVIMNDFYKTIFFALIFICLLLAYVFSNLISKPLLKLNQTAKKMSNMDFTEKCEIKRNDEIGNLASTLNFLSSNLSSALDDLQVKNKSLEKEIERERKVEKFRKDFIAGVSHELKTPIGIISGYAEGLKDGVVDDDSRDVYLDVIIDEANKMNKLVLDMLNLTKLESGKTELVISNFSLKELTQTIISKHTAGLEEKGFTLNLDISPTDNFYAVGDSFKIEQVITNFVTNAIKYSPNNESINISIRRRKNQIFFYIENTGTFLDETTHQKIWTQFYRVDNSRNRDGGSTGLGLSIAKNILELHHSSFGSKNTEKGVIFYFSLEVEA